MDVQWYRVCDDLSGGLILPMLIFSPWAFGTAERWSIRCMNLAGYALGLLWLCKVFIRYWKQYPAPRWDHFSIHSGRQSRHRYRAPRRLAMGLGGLTVAVLAYILLSALNAAAEYNPVTHLFQYHHYISWLPHSFDSRRTWFCFWTYLGLAAAFWALADWLPGMTLVEEQAALAVITDEEAKRLPLLSARVRVLLWLLCLNGAVLGLESIVQRVSGSSKLLFIVQPPVNREALFGPFAYRSNAAQYFNLVWPLCLGFWATIQRAGGLRAKSHHWLLLGAGIMASCPIISTSRGGALVAVGMLILALGYLLVTNRRPGGRAGSGAGSDHTTGLLLLFLGLTLALGWYFGWNLLEPRMEQIGSGYDSREEMYVAARPMTRDFPWFGTGPGTFGTVFQLYRYSTDVYWPEQLHNDWLETRITFGWVGFSLLLAALGCVGLRWLLPGGLRASRRLVFLAWTGLGGCLVHALFDFPFQLHSTLFMFLVICALLWNLSLAEGSGRR